MCHTRLICTRMRRACIVCALAGARQRCACVFLVIKMKGTVIVHYLNSEHWLSYYIVHACLKHSTWYIYSFPVLVTSCVYIICTASIELGGCVTTGTIHDWMLPLTFHALRQICFRSSSAQQTTGQQPPQWSRDWYRDLLVSSCLAATASLCVCDQTEDKKKNETPYKYTNYHSEIIYNAFGSQDQCLALHGLHLQIPYLLNVSLYIWVTSLVPRLAALACVQGYMTNSLRATL